MSSVHISQDQRKTFKVHVNHVNLFIRKLNQEFYCIKWHLASFPFVLDDENVKKKKQNKFNERKKYENFDRACFQQSHNTITISPEFIECFDIIKHYQQFID